MSPDVILVVTGVAWLLWAGWWMREYCFKPLRAQRKVLGAEDDVLLGKVAETITMLHDVFGPQVRIRMSGTKDGRSITLVCERCSRSNRLVRGFRGARCGNCKSSLVTKEMRTSTENEVKLN